MKAALLTLGDSEIELLEPIVTDNGIARYLEAQGRRAAPRLLPGRSTSNATSRALKERGIEMIDQETRIGLAGRICFLHPKAMDGALVELCQPLDE